MTEKKKKNSIRAASFSIMFPLVLNVFIFAFILPSCFCWSQFGSDACHSGQKTLSQAATNKSNTLNIAWNVTLSDYSFSGYGLDGSSRGVFNEVFQTVVGPSGSFIVSLRASDGSVAWKSCLGKEEKTGCVPFPNPLFNFSRDDVPMALDVAIQPNGNIVAFVTVPKKVVSIFVLSGKDGSLLWRAPDVVFLGIPVLEPILVHPVTGDVFVLLPTPTERFLWTLTKWDAENGTLLWNLTNYFALYSSGFFQSTFVHDLSDDSLWFYARLGSTTDTMAYIKVNATNGSVLAKSSTVGKIFGSSIFDVKSDLVFTNSGLCGGTSLRSKDGSVESCSHSEDAFVTPVGMCGKSTLWRGQANRDAANGLIALSGENLTNPLIWYYDDLGRGFNVMWTASPFQSNALYALGYQDDNRALYLRQIDCKSGNVLNGRVFGRDDMMGQCSMFKYTGPILASDGSLYVWWCRAQVIKFV